MTNQTIDFESIIYNLLPTPYIEFAEVCKNKGQTPHTGRGHSECLML